MTCRTFVSIVANVCDYCASVRASMGACIYVEVFFDIMNIQCVVLTCIESYENVILCMSTLLFQISMSAIVTRTTAAKSAAFVKTFPEATGASVWTDTLATEKCAMVHVTFGY